MQFSIGDCVRFGWETFKKRPWFFIGVTILFSVIGGISSNISSNGWVDGVPSGTGVFLWLIDLLVVQVLVYMGEIHLFLKAHDDTDGVTLMDAWKPQLYAKFLGTYLLTGFIITLGLILLIVPGIILAVGLFAAPYLVIDKGLSPLEAIRASWEMTKGHRWTLAGLLLTIVGIALLGVLALLVGVLVASPVIFLAMTHAYRQLSKTSA